MPKFHNRVKFLRHDILVVSLDRDDRHTAFVDVCPETTLLLHEHKWHAYFSVKRKSGERTYYMAANTGDRKQGYKRILFHRCYMELLGVKSSHDVAFIDGDGLNCTRRNIKVEPDRTTL